MTKQTKTTDKNIVSRAEFARLQGYGRARVTQLANEGRLVLAENGKDVNVLASTALIESTKDLSKLGTIARHAKAREQKKTQNEIQLQNELNELNAAYQKLHREFVGWFDYASKLDGGCYRYLETIADLEQREKIEQFIYSDFAPFDDDEQNEHGGIFAELNTPIE